nr:hypothetical protein [Pseudopedobacter sp.]
MSSPLRLKPVRGIANSFYLSVPDAQANIWNSVFLKALPNTVFQRKEAVAIGKQFDLSARSVDSFLKNSIGTILTCVKTGYYQKKD